MPPSVKALTSEDVFSQILWHWRRICPLRDTGNILSVSPNFPTYPSSDAAAAIKEERLSITATVTEPYSEGMAPHSEPELSDRHMVFP